MQCLETSRKPQSKTPVTEVDVLLSQPEPKTRDRFLKYSCEITLDPNTAHTQLLLSEENRRVTLLFYHESYFDHPYRFTSYKQVVSRESLNERCYWEVLRRGRGVIVAVASKNIRTAEDECWFGHDDQSWALECCNKNSYIFWHNNIQTPVSGPRSSRVGVYLDHRAGILSFYSVSETMTLLHRVQTTFTQPLYAGLRWLLVLHLLFLYCSLWKTYLDFLIVQIINCVCALSLTFVVDVNQLKVAQVIGEATICPPHISPSLRKHRGT
uniref:B30.2/SPRY domain-containing protein n=1 Tax=Pundamilia nyererei TaxID=303518 RepID=A0A3B4H9M1_9CICH